MSLSSDKHPRSRGRPPVITREQIIRAAREIGIDDLRMAAVAEALNVRPATLYHHVRDRDELIQLVAWQVLEETEYDEWAPRADASWQEWVRAYADALRTAMREHAALLQYIRLTTATTARRLDQMEQLLTVLIDAGFDLETARCAIEHVHLVVEAEGRDKHMAGSGENRQVEEFLTALAARPSSDLPLLRSMAQNRAVAETDSRFAFALDCLLAGMAAKRS